ncbi:MAG: sensor histidine kinase [Bryobacteraceae bacterium]
MAERRMSVLDGLRAASGRSRWPVQEALDFLCSSGEVAGAMLYAIDSEAGVARLELVAGKYAAPAEVGLRDGIPEISPVHGTPLAGSHYLAYVPNPEQKLDEPYRRFLALAAEPVGALIEQARAEAFVEFEQLYRLVLRATNDVIRNWDLRTGVVRWNESLQNLFGYSPSQITPDISWWRERIHPEDRERVVGELETLMARGGEHWNGEYRFLRSGGASSDVLDRVHVIYDDAGKPVRLIGAMLDITLRKRTEEALTIQASALARSNADLQQFAYVTSHDLQEPLRTIASYSALLSQRYEGKLDSDADEFLAYIEQGAKRMSALVHDLLTYSRVVTPEPAEFSPIDLHATLRWALSNLKASLEEHDAAVTYDRLPVVKGDQVMLVQLLQNLIGNAIKYRKPDLAPSIHLSVNRRGDEWLFTVADNGIGIDAKYHELIFGVFKRLHSGRTAGTGIGLAICKKIVERHGGRIWVESEPEQGARFRFTLPA